MDVMVELAAPKKQGRSRRVAAASITFATHALSARRGYIFVPSVSLHLHHEGRTVWFPRPVLVPVRTGSKSASFLHSYDRAAAGDEARRAMSGECRPGTGLARSRQMSAAREAARHFRHFSVIKGTERLVSRTTLCTTLCFRRFHLLRKVECVRFAELCRRYRWREGTSPRFFL